MRFAVLALCALVIAGAPPVLFHASTPTEPGSTLLVSGAGLTNATLTLCILGSLCAPLPVVQQWGGGIKAVLPSLPRAYAGNVTATSSEGASSAAPLNFPAVEWTLGAGAERDGAAVAGGVLRLFGVSLAWDAAAGNCPAIRSVPTAPPSGVSVTLVPTAGGAPIELGPPLVASCYRLDVAVPAAAPVGDYGVWVNNGLFPPSAPGALALPLLHVDAPAAWPPTPFTLGTNCASLPACLSAAGAAGGGIVTIPPGVTVSLSDGETLALPPRVQLQGGGAGAGGSVVAWPSNTGPYAFDGFVSGPGPWVLRDLALLFPMGMGGAAAVHIAPGSVGCTVERVLVNASAPGPNATFGAGVGALIIDADAQPGGGHTRHSCAPVRGSAAALLTCAHTHTHTHPTPSFAVLCRCRHWLLQARPLGGPSERGQWRRARGAAGRVVSWRGAAQQLPRAVAVGGARQRLSAACGGRRPRVRRVLAAQRRPVGAVCLKRRDPWQRVPRSVRGLRHGLFLPTVCCGQSV